MLTGPNMAGKSTILRSVCAVALLGACGLYAPAAEARVPYFGEAGGKGGGLQRGGEGEVQREGTAWLGTCFGAACQCPHTATLPPAPITHCLEPLSTPLFHPLSPATCLLPQMPSCCATSRRTRRWRGAPRLR